MIGRRGPWSLGASRSRAFSFSRLSLAALTIQTSLGAPQRVSRGRRFHSGRRGDHRPGDLQRVVEVPPYRNGPQGRTSQPPLNPPWLSAWDAAHQTARCSISTQQASRPTAPLSPAGERPCDCRSGPPATRRRAAAAGRGGRHECRGCVRAALFRTACTNAWAPLMAIRRAPPLRAARPAFTFSHASRVGAECWM